MTRTLPRTRRPAIRHRLVWHAVTCHVLHTRDFMSPGWTQLEIVVVTPKGAPMPITETGYLAHYIDAAELVAAGGPVAFFTAWLEREAATKRYAKAAARWRQLPLL